MREKIKRCEAMVNYTNVKEELRKCFSGSSEIAESLIARCSLESTVNEINAVTVAMQQMIEKGKATELLNSVAQHKARTQEEKVPTEQKNNDEELYLSFAQNGTIKPVEFVSKMNQLVKTGKMELEKAKRLLNILSCDILHINPHHPMLDYRSNLTYLIEDLMMAAMEFETGFAKIVDHFAVDLAK